MRGGASGTDWREQESHTHLSPVSAAVTLLGHHISLLLGQPHLLSSCYHLRCVSLTTGTVPEGGREVG